MNIRPIMPTKTINLNTFSRKHISIGKTSVKQTSAISILLAALMKSKIDSLKSSSKVQTTPDNIREAALKLGSDIKKMCVEREKNIKNEEIIKGFEEKFSKMKNGDCLKVTDSELVAMKERREFLKKYPNGYMV